MAITCFLSRRSCQSLQQCLLVSFTSEHCKLDYKSIIQSSTIFPHRYFSASTTQFAMHKPGQYVRIKKRAHEFDNIWNSELAAWTDRNNIVYPPLNPTDGIRPAEIYHGRKDVRYSYRKLFHLAKLIKLMNIDEAISFLRYVNSKGATIIREVLVEAKEKAEKEHIEFKSNFHIVKSFATHTGSLKFPIYRGRTSVHIGETRFSNYYVMIREGPSPAKPKRVTAYEMALHHLDNMRSRTIIEGL